MSPSHPFSEPLFKACWSRKSRLIANYKKQAGFRLETANMPTPSNLHNPDSRAYPFSSTCPDDQTAVPTQPPSPSSWNPPLPSSYAERVVVTVSASDSDGPITSRPASRSDDDRASPNTDTGDDAHDNDDDVQNGMDPVDYESTRLDTDDELSPEQSGAATAQGGSSVPASSTSGISHATPSRSADEDVDMQHNWADGPSMSDSYFSQLRVRRDPFLSDLLPSPNHNRY